MNYEMLHTRLNPQFRGSTLESREPTTVEFADWTCANVQANLLMRVLALGGVDADVDVARVGEFGAEVTYRRAVWPAPDYTARKITPRN